MPLTARQEMRKHLRKHYNMGIDEFDALNKVQKGLCAICRRTNGKRRLGVDHNHATLKNRGLLCDRCNKGIGYFQEDIDRLLAAVYYLEHHNG